MNNREKALEIFRAMKKDTKTRRVLQHIIDNRGISSMDAFELYRATRLSAIIFTLKHNYGIEIETIDMVLKDGTRYAEYRLV